MMVIQEMMDRQQLHGGHTKLVEIGEGVGIKEQLGRVEAMAVLWDIRTVHAIAIALPRTEPGHIPMPDIIRAGWQRDVQRLVGTLRGVEEAEINPRSMLGEQREIHPRT